MTIETKYEYRYYTIIDVEQWRHGNEEIFGDGFTWGKSIDFIDNKFKTSEDKTVGNFRVDAAWYCDDIDNWLRAQHRNNVRPIFLQFQDNQPIMKTGGGCLFELYEEEEVWYSSDEDDNQVFIGAPDYNDIDGLSGAGGRL